MTFDCNHEDPPRRKRVIRINRASFFAAVREAVSDELRAIADGEIQPEVADRLRVAADAFEIGQRPEALGNEQA
jgi:hypothetical protein